MWLLSRGQATAISDLHISSHPTRLATNLYITSHRPLREFPTKYPRMCTIRISQSSPVGLQDIREIQSIIEDRCDNVCFWLSECL
jgi:hypothetical protein